ncbi:protein of unknown function [Shewanella benthica]|uniref:Uncharacterized protein n=1 Tax=Shewanella benthica TaxID=43661 RepID=A0A330M9K9_9GAMM|nr:protein of unknown function [Shewanella benthica]
MRRPRKGEYQDDTSKPAASTHSEKRLISNDDPFFMPVFYLTQRNTQ